MMSKWVPGRWIPPRGAFRVPDGQPQPPVPVAVGPVQRRGGAVVDRLTP